MSARYRLHIKSEIPETFFDLYLNDYNLTPQQVDIGCVQKNFIDIDIDSTFQALAGFLSGSDTKAENEARWLKSENIDLVISDVASLPLKAARLAAIPSLLVGNFTWHDIYSGFPGADRRQNLLNQLQDEYACATLQLLPQCHIRNNVVPRQQEIGWIAMRGRNVRDQIENHLGTRLDGKTLVFVYLGQAGAPEVNWSALARLENCVFLTRDPLGHTGINRVQLDDRFGYPDLIATSDLVCTKGGYSTLATAFYHDRPVLTCTRNHFSEFEVIREYLEQNGVGLILDPDRFYTGDWSESIKKAGKLSVKGNVRLNGEAEALQTIDNLITA